MSLVPRPCREVDLHRSGTWCCLRSSRRASNLSFRGVGCSVNGEEGTRGWPCTWATGTQQCPAVWLVHEPTVLCFSLYSPLTPPVASFKYTDRHYSDRARPIFSLTVYIYMPFPSQPSSRRNNEASGAFTYSSRQEFLATTPGNHRDTVIRQLMILLPFSNSIVVSCALSLILSF